MRKDQKKIDRNHSRWVVAEDEFKGLRKYPFDHCNGYLSMMTGDLILPMYSAAKVNPWFWIDDIYLYGMLPHTIGDVTFKGVRATFWIEVMRKCVQKKKIDCDIDVFCEYRTWASYLNTRSRFWPMMISNISRQQRDAYQFNEFISYVNFTS